MRASRPWWNACTAQHLRVEPVDRVLVRLDAREDERRLLDEQILRAPSRRCGRAWGSDRAASAASSPSSSAMRLIGTSNPLSGEDVDRAAGELQAFLGFSRAGH